MQIVFLGALMGVCVEALLLEGEELGKGAVSWGSHHLEEGTYPEAPAP